MEINIDSKAIEDAIVKGVIDSAIGKQIVDVIQDIINEKTSPWGSKNILHDAIKREVNKVIGRIVQEEILKNEEKIKGIILPKITEKVLDDLVTASFNVMIGNINDSDR